MGSRYKQGELEPLQKLVEWWGNQLGRPMELLDVKSAQFSQVTGGYPGRGRQNNDIRCFVCDKWVSSGDPHRVGTIVEAGTPTRHGNVILCMDKPRTCRERAEAHLFRKAVASE